MILRTAKRLLPILFVSVAASAATPTPPGEHAEPVKLPSAPAGKTLSHDELLAQAKLLELVDEGQKALMSRKFTRARDRFLRCVAMQPSLARCHLHLGATYARMGLTLDAIASYQTYLMLEPEGVEAGKVRQHVALYRDILEGEDEREAQVEREREIPTAAPDRRPIR